MFLGDHSSFFVLYFFSFSSDNFDIFKQYFTPQLTSFDSYIDRLPCPSPASKSPTTAINVEKERWLTPSPR